MACGCQHSGFETCSQCEFEPFVKNCYFTGKLMGASDFIAEQAYHSEKMRHHNVRLHGSGVVCGLRVHQHDSPDCQKRYVVVEPGSALDCCGHEILVPDEEYVDVSQNPAVLAATADGRSHTLQIVACYRECPTEQVPVLYDDCGCGDDQCAANRILESYAFDVLVDPPLSDGMGTSAAAGAFVATDKHGAGGWVRGNDAGRVAIVDPATADPKRVFLLDPAHRSRVTIDLDATVRGVALSQDGSFLFVLVDASASDKSQVLVFDATTGAAVPPTTAGAIHELPNADATHTYSLATAGGTPSLFVYDETKGDVYPWDADATAGIKDAAGAALSLGTGSDLVASTDGKLLGAIDGQKVIVGDLASGALTTSSLTVLPSGVAAASLAAFELGSSTTFVLVTGETDEKAYVVDPAGVNATSSVALDHPALRVGVTGDPSAPQVTVYEEEAGHAYVQSFVLNGATPTAQPVARAPRAAGDGPVRVVVVHVDGSVSLVDPNRFADSDCAGLVCLQGESCPDCATDDCVVLATIPGYRAGTAILDQPPKDATKPNAWIDLRAGRRIVASTATLQAWLECLQLKGGVPGPRGPQGPKGDSGGGGTQITKVVPVDLPCGSQPTADLQGDTLTIGIPRGCDGANGANGQDACDPNLTQICGINWDHGRQPHQSLLQRQMVIVTFNHDITPPDPDLDLRHIFIVETNRHIEDGTAELEAWYQLQGKYLLLRTTNPCQPDDAKEVGAGPVNAIGFYHERGFKDREYRVRVHGDLLMDLNGKGIDGNHLPKWLPGQNTGDCIEGGTFYSWFRQG